MIEGARLVRGALRALGLESWVKTTGGLGLHLVAPLLPERDWSERPSALTTPAVTVVWKP